MDRPEFPKGELWDKVFSKLTEKIEAEGMQTGFFATEHILPLLAENGKSKLAYDLLLQENCPGWMYQVKRGATTIWERWDALRPDRTVNESSTSGGDDNMVSFNHYAFGSVGNSPSVDLHRSRGQSIRFDEVHSRFYRSGKFEADAPRTVVYVRGIV